MLDPRDDYQIVAGIFSFRDVLAGAASAGSDDEPPSGKCATRANIRKFVTAYLR